MAAFLSFNKIGKKNNNVNLLADLSFGVQKGESLCILGKSNSGKSVLFQILMGIIKKDKGQIFVNGMDYDIRKNEILPMIGYVPQESIFDENLNIYDNLLIYSSLYGLKRDKIKKEIKYWSDILQITKYLKKTINSSPDSILKKASFVRALIHNPDILLMDDITSSMDYYDKNIIFETIQSIQKNKSILFITQNFNLAEIYSDRIILIDNGTVAFNGSIQNLDNKINDTYKYRFTFKRIVPSEFLKTVRNNNEINHITSRDNNLELTIQDKSVFFDIFKIAINYELVDLKISNSKLSELFKKVTNSK